MTPHLSFDCAILLISLSVASGCGTSGQNGNGKGVVTNSDQAGESADTLYYLDISTPSIEQAIDARIAANATPKFVQVEVTQVTNPKKHPLTFEVRYRSTSNAPIYLGSFSLYPSDNPGKFLVATQGKVTGEGAIILSLMTPDKIDSTDVVRVAVKPFTLLNG
ncbi:MAG: hypothetical protein H7Z74_04345 [Anaerolineae bacterium]|nr:hypothetical protein [Gemmatimonadaceae bacterium]